MSKNEPSIGEHFKPSSSMKIGYVSLNVSDLQQSLEFYEEILGFKIASRVSGERALLSVDGNPLNLLELSQAKIDSSVDAFTHKRAGLYHFAVLLPERRHLADMLQNLSYKREQVHFDGLADHLVSESIYVRDPDFIGIEIYRDRPASEWIWDGNRVRMATLPLDTNDLLKESSDKGWRGMPAGTTIGHVHLHVSDTGKAARFYHEIMGLNLTATLPGAAFFAAGKYHHHVAANTWLGSNISPASPESIGLNHFSIELPTQNEYAGLIKRLSSYDIGPSDSERSAFVHDMDGIRMKIQRK